CGRSHFSIRACASPALQYVHISGGIAGGCSQRDLRVAGDLYAGSPATAIWRAVPEEDIGFLALVSGAGLWGGLSGRQPDSIHNDFPVYHFDFARSLARGPA